MWTFNQSKTKNDNQKLKNFKYFLVSCAKGTMSTRKQTLAKLVNGG